MWGLGMTKDKIVVLIVIGSVIGFGIYYMKANADRASQIIANMEGSSLQSCLDFNETVRKYSPETEQMDCEKDDPN